MKNLQIFFANNDQFKSIEKRDMAKFQDTLGQRNTDLDTHLQRDIQKLTIKS